MQSPRNYKQWVPSNIGSGSQAIQIVAPGQYREWLRGTIGRGSRALYAVANKNNGFAAVQAVAPVQYT